MPVKRRCSLRKLFNAIDADGSGEVTLAEVTKAFKKAAGKDELLTYNEFSKMCRKYGGRSAVDNDMAVIYQLFAKLDTDGNGYISIDEFFDEDKDGNGLSLEEFLKNFGSMTADQLRVATRLFEKISKGDGTISREDFKAAAGDDDKLTKAELHKVYNANSAARRRGSARRGCGPNQQYYMGLCIPSYGNSKTRGSSRRGGRCVDGYHWKTKDPSKPVSGNNGKCVKD